MPILSPKRKPATPLTTALLVAIACVTTGGIFDDCDPPRNPVQDTAKAAPGNTDWHDDSARAFLDGKDMAGTTIANNHCPWVGISNVHNGLTHTHSYYYDEALGGDDRNSPNGIDTTMLFFYAGHGNPGAFSTLGTGGAQPNIRVGNYTKDNPGILRYLWMCSCEVWAHGPELPADCSSTASTFNYSCPGDFDGSSDSESMRNVYERWEDSLGIDLRMACGSSTSAWCWQSETNRIWDNYNNKGFDVADSFIYGLYRNANNVPLCMTRGDLSLTSTPLYTDTVFTNQRNNADGTAPYTHIQYLLQFDKDPNWMFVPVDLVAMPIYYVERMDLPRFLAETKFSEQGDFLASEDQVPEGVLDEGDRMVSRVRIHPNSGAVYMRGTADHSDTELSREDYIAKAQSHLKELGLEEENAFEPQGIFMMTQKKHQEMEKPENGLKNVIVRFQRNVPVGKELVPVIGAGGNMEVQMNPDGSLLRLSKVWRQIVGASESMPLGDLEQIQLEAWDLLQNPQTPEDPEAEWTPKEFYENDRTVLAYKESAGNVEQSELVPFYQFLFVPREGTYFDGKERKQIKEGYPPQFVEVQAIKR